MKKGEVYYNKFNHYKGTVVDITDMYVSLETKSGVRDLIRRDRFDLNWIKQEDKSDYIDLIKKYFPNSEVSANNENIIVDDKIVFSIVDTNTLFTVEFNCSLKKTLGDSMIFALEDIDEALELIAGLYKD